METLNVGGFIPLFSIFSTFLLPSSFSSKSDWYSSYSPVSLKKIIQRVDFYLDPYDADQGSCPSSDTRILSIPGRKFPNLNNVKELNLAKFQQMRLQGLWIVYEDVEYKLNTTWLLAGVGSDTWWCVYDTAGPLHVKSLRFLGNPDASLPGLSLLFEYAHDSDVCGPEMYVEKTRSDFGTPMSISFWAVTGNQNWTLYSKKNFEGESLCLISQNDTNFFYNFGHLVPPRLVGSVKEGCFGEIAGLYQTRKTL